MATALPVPSGALLVCLLVGPFAPTIHGASRTTASPLTQEAKQYARRSIGPGPIAEDVKNEHPLVRAGAAGRAWLIRSQLPSGAWSVDGGAGAGDVLSTGMALWALSIDPTEQALAAGAAWLAGLQDEQTGRIGDADDRTQAIVLIGLSEAMRKDPAPEMERAAKRLVAHVAGSGENGSAAGGLAELEAAAWRSLALALAANAGFGKGETLASEAKRLVAGMPSLERPSGADAEADPGGRNALARWALIFTSAALRDESGLAAARAGYRAPDPKTLSDLDPRGWFAITYFLYQAGGEAWQPWKERPNLIAELQVFDGEVGYWDAEGVGRTAATSWLLMCTDVYFRYARVSKAR